MTEQMSLDDVIVLARGAAQRRGLDHYNADEVAQLVAIKYQGRIDRGEPLHNTEGWIVTAVRTTVIDDFRARDRHDRRRHVPASDDDRLGQVVSTSFGSLRPVARAQNDAVLALLSATEAEIVRLRFIDGLTNPEAAEELGITAEACAQRASRAIKKLRLALEGHPDLKAELQLSHPRLYRVPARR